MECFPHLKLLSRCNGGSGLPSSSAELILCPCGKSSVLNPELFFFFFGKRFQISDLGAFSMALLLVRMLGPSTIQSLEFSGLEFVNLA